jgi:hypothetical protein
MIAFAKRSYRYGGRNGGWLWVESELDKGSKFFSHCRKSENSGREGTMPTLKAAK